MKFKRGVIKTEVMSGPPKQRKTVIDETTVLSPLIAGEVLAEVFVEQSWVQTADYQSVGIKIGVTLPVVLDHGGPCRVDAPFDTLPVEHGIKEAQKIGWREMNRIGERLRKKLLE